MSSSISTSFGSIDDRFLASAVRAVAELFINAARHVSDTVLENGPTFAIPCVSNEVCAVTSTFEATSLVTKPTSRLRFRIVEDLSSILLTN